MITSVDTDGGCAVGRGLPHEHCFVLLPPYRSFLPLPVSREAPSLPGGAVVALRVTGNPHEQAALPAVVRDLRARFRAAPVVLWVPPDPNPGVLHLAYGAARLGVRTVLLGDGPHAETLRLACTRPLDLGASVVEWLGIRGVRIPPVLRAVLEQVFQHAARYPELRALLGEMRVPETSLRSRCGKLRLPPPSHWHQAARGLHAALAIQADAANPLARLAWQLGYADHSALSQLLHRAFGVRPGALRGTVGWEWLMERWCLQRIDRLPLPAVPLASRGRDSSDESDAFCASTAGVEMGTIVARSGSTPGAASRPPAAGVMHARARLGALPTAIFAGEASPRGERQVPQPTPLTDEVTMNEKNLINDDLFAEELPEQVDLTEAAGCFGTFGCLGSIGGCFGCFGTYGCGGGELERPTDGLESAA